MFLGLATQVKLTRGYDMMPVLVLYCTLLASQQEAGHELLGLLKQRAGRAYPWAARSSRSPAGSLRSPAYLGRHRPGRVHA